MKGKSKHKDKAIIQLGALKIHLDNSISNDDIKQILIRMEELRIKSNGKENKFK